MKILYLVHHYPPEYRGGTEVYTQKLAKFFSANNEVAVVATKIGPSPKISFVKKQIESVTVYEINRPIIKQANESLKNSEIELLGMQILDEFRPDLIHIQHLMYLSVSLIDVIRQRKIPMVMTLHDFWYICPQAHLMMEGETVCEGPREGRTCRACKKAGKNEYALALPNFPQRGVLAAVLPVPLRKFIKKGMNALQKKDVDWVMQRLQYMKEKLSMVDLIISPSRHMARVYAGEGIANIQVVSHGIQDDGIIKKTGGEFIIGYFGGISSIKGIHILVDAVTRINNPRIELRIYGNVQTDDKFGKAIKEKCRRNNIKIIGHIDHREIQAKIAEETIVIIPSLCVENYPLIALEALMARTPIIGSNIGGIAEIVIDRENGRLFEPGNVLQLAAIIQELFNDRRLADTYSSQIRKPKTISQHVDELEKIYFNLTAGNKLRTNKG